MVKRPNWKKPDETLWREWSKPNQIGCLTVCGIWYLSPSNPDITECEGVEWWKSHMVLFYFSSGQSQLKTYWYFDYTKYLRDILQKNISWQIHLSRYIARRRSHWATVDQLGKNVFYQGVNFHSWNNVDVYEVPKHFCGVLVWRSWR